MIDLIASHLTHCRARGLAQNTIESREELLRRADRELPLGLNEATTEELAEWLARRKWSAQTRATYYTHLTSYYRWGADPRRPVGLDFDPSIGLDRPRVPRGLPRPVSDDQATVALANLPQPYLLFVKLAAYAGLRAAEIAGLDRLDVTEQAVTVVGKGGKHRVIPTHPALWSSLALLPAGPIAVLSGRQLTPYEVSHRTAYHLKRVGLAKVTLHKFRHWMATTALANGANLRTIQELLGHASPDTTAIYTFVTDGQREIAIRTLPVLVPIPS